MEIIYTILESLKEAGRGAGLLLLVFFAVPYLVRFGWLWAGKEYIELMENLENKSKD